jgi:hypothetical protein
VSDIVAAVDKVKAARAVLASFRPGKDAAQAARTALALAESELREIGKRHGISICILQPEPSNECIGARTIKNWQSSPEA